MKYFFIVFLLLISTNGFSQNNDRWLRDYSQQERTDFLIKLFHRSFLEPETYRPHPLLGDSGTLPCIRSLERQLRNKINNRPLYCLGLYGKGNKFYQRCLKEGPMDKVADWTSSHIDAFVNNKSWADTYVGGGFVFLKKNYIAKLGQASWQIYYVPEITKFLSPIFTIGCNIP